MYNYTSCTCTVTSKHNYNDVCRLTIHCSQTHSII